MVTTLVVGATGKQGGSAIQTLLAEKNPDLTLRFITRNPTSASASNLTSQGAEAIKADLLDRKSLDAALKGVDRAFLVTDAAMGEKETDQGKIFVDAAKAAGVKHLVFTSVSSADVATQVPHFRTKFEIEKHLKASGLQYTILRPVAFMDNFPVAPGIGRFLGVGVFYTFTGFKPVQFIAVKDIGIVAGKALAHPEDPTFRNTTIDLTAGEYSMEDVRTSIQKAQGGGAPYFASYTPKILRRLVPYDFRMMMEYFEKTGYPSIDTSLLKSVVPTPTTFEDYFKEKA